MSYSRDELDWLEAEWAYHLHGRTAFLSREDFLQLERWSQQGIPAAAVVAAMETYFERRAKRRKPRTFIALSHLGRDVEKAARLRKALAEAEDVPHGPEADWDSVMEPLRSNPRARVAYEAWQRAARALPAPDHPGYLEAFDAERKALRDLLALGVEAFGARAESLREELVARLKESGIEEGSLVWRRAWDHHWTRMLSEALGLKV